MPRKRHNPEQIPGKLREVGVSLAKEQTVAVAVRQIAVTGTDLLPLAQRVRRSEHRPGRRLKQLEQENARLKRAVSNLTLES